MQKVERDPVCGTELRPEEAAATVQFQGETYFFDTERCKEAFQQNPMKYLSKLRPD